MEAVSYPVVGSCVGWFELKQLLATRRAAAAGHAAFVRRDPVIHAEFSAGGDALQRINFDPLPEDPQIAVRLTTVVQVLEWLACRAVQRPSPAQLDQVDFGTPLHCAARLRQPHQCSLNLPEFLPRRPRMVQLAELIHLYLLDELDYDVEIWIRKEEVPTVQLGSRTSPALLGLNSWTHGEQLQDRSVVFRTN